MLNIDKKIKKLENNLEDCRAQQRECISGMGEFPTPDQDRELETLKTEETDIRGMLKKAQAAKSAGMDLTGDLTEFTSPLKPSQPGGKTIPAVPIKSHLECFSSERNAMNFGLFALATAGSRPAEDRLRASGIDMRAGMTEDVNSAGGHTVPIELAADLIRLVESRGVFRQNANVVLMSSDTLNIPRQSAGNTAYFVGEASAITESNPTLDQITLVLRKVACLTSFSNELSTDSLISIGEYLGKEFSYRLADKEDECGFNGDGSGTYGGIVGVRQQLIEKNMAGDETGTAAGGVVRYGTGQEFSNIGMDDMTLLISKLPMYAEANAKWYMSKTVWAYVLDLMADAGGNTINTISAGAEKTFLGYPVVLVDVMPKTSAINQMCILLGDLSQAAAMGVDRQGVRIESSNSAYVGSTSMFETDQVAIRGIERFDVNVHDVGDGTDAGPIVGLISHTA